jgi:hypothetical protein
MPKIYFTGFGRGSVGFGKTAVQNAYNGVKTLINTTKLSDDNIADNAGIPEAWFQFDITDQGHSHADGSLADASIGGINIDVSSDPKKFTILPVRTEWVLSQCPGTKMIVGETVAFQLIDQKEVLVYFGEGVVKPSPFAPGSVPVVQLTPCSYNETVIGGEGNSNTFNKSFWLTVKEVTDTYFTFVIHIPSASLSVQGFSITAFYCAIATAPGYLFPIGGV